LLGEGEAARVVRNLGQREAAGVSTRGYERTSAAGDEKSVIPSPILQGAAKQFVGPCAASPKYLDQKEAHDPFPAYRPLTGSAGITCPGAQWNEHPSTGGSYAQSMLSESAAQFQNLDHRSVHIDKESPLSDIMHGKGTGYCSNTGSIRSVNWMHNAPHDTFRTSYKDLIETGFSSARRRS